MSPFEQSIINAGWGGPFGFVKGLLIVFDVLLVAGFLYAVVRGWKFRPSFDFGRAPRKRTLTLGVAVYGERWQGITKKFSLASPEAVRVALIEADALVDEVLKQLGLPGEHMADRLQGLASEEIKSLGRLWRAHQLRNELVHTPGFSVSSNDAQFAFQSYEAFLKEIGALP